jgi:hypothetical protein
MKAKLRIPEIPEFLRNKALREAPRISSFGWRPSAEDLALLRNSARDPVAYKTTLGAWRRAGFKVLAIKRLANRAPRRP